jgi:predicted DCC family thiol-disulfide oxidoreductase YuxK
MARGRIVAVPTTGETSSKVSSAKTFVYDGDCAFCSTCARFIERRVHTSAAVVAWQRTDYAALGLTAAQCEEAVQWVSSAGIASGPDAISRLLLDAGPLWKAPGWVLGLPPVRWVAWPAYRWVARNRHRLPGGTATCSLPQAERDRLAG